MRESPSRSNETTTLTTLAIEVGASMASTIVATDAAFPMLNTKSATEGPYIASMSPRSGQEAPVEAAAHYARCVPEEHRAKHETEAQIPIG